MKFLCVPCDQPMKVLNVTPPDRGSIAVTYSCPACGYEMAMLTNPFETQLVSSMGIKVGPAASAGPTLIPIEDTSWVSNGLVSMAIS